MEIETKIDVYYDTIEELEKGKCEIVSITQDSPYGNWKECTIATLIIEVK